MSPRPDVSEERRERIILSAMEVFARQGFADSRMDEIAVKAGVSKGLLYWYFRSKEEIIIAIANMLFAGELRQIREVSMNEGMAANRVAAVVEAFIHDTKLMIKLAPVVYEFYSLAFRNKAVRSAMSRFLKNFTDILEPVFEEGINSGEFIGEDPKAMALAIGAAIEGTLLFWAYDPKMVDAERQIRFATRIAVEGIKRHE